MITEKQRKLLIELKKEETQLLNELFSFAQKDPHIDGAFTVSFPKKEGNQSEETAREIEEFERLNALKSNLEKRLHDVRRTIKKIEDGLYGQCDNCSKSIENTRLQVMPVARFCLECTRQNPRGA